jgi:hypothetical protein
MFSYFSIPLVRRQIEGKLRHLHQQLQKHPDMPQNAELEIRQAIAQFTAGVRDYFSTQARTDWADIQKRFTTQILQLKPKFNVKPEEPYRVEANGVIAIADTESVASVNSTPVKRRLPSEDVGLFVTPASKRRMGPNGLKVEDQNPFATPTGRPFYNTPRAPIRRSARTLRQLRQLIEERKAPGVPHLIPESVYVDLCRDAVQPWNVPLEDLVRESAQVLTLHLKGILDRAFVKLEKRAIYKQVGEHIQVFIQEAMENLQVDLQKLYRLETRQIFTMNASGTKLNRTDERRTLARHRHHYRAMAHFGERAVPKEWTQMNDEEKSQEAARTAKELHKLGPDDYESELDVAAYVRGYFLTAAARYIDTVLLHITSGLLPDLADQIDGYVDRKLGLPAAGAPQTSEDSNRFDELMAEEAKDAEKRAFLKGELEKFIQAKASIQGLEGPTAAADTDGTLVSEEDDENGFGQDDEVYMVDN